MVSEVNKVPTLCVYASCPDLVGKANGTKNRREMPESQKSG